MVGLFVVDKVRWNGYVRVTEVSSRWSAFHHSSILVYRSWGSTFGINQTARSSDAARGKIFLSSPKHPDRPWGPPSLLFSGYWGFCPEVKRQGREANLSPQSSAEIKDNWNCNSAPFICLCDVSKKNIVFYPLSFISPPSGPRVCNNPDQEKYYISLAVFLSFSDPNLFGNRLRHISTITPSVIARWCPLIQHRHYHFLVFYMVD